MSMINAMPMGGGIDYSLEEQDTGLKWIDGKKIYQKTVDFGALPNATTKEIAHEISNLKYIIDLFGFAVRSLDNMFISLPFVVSNSNGESNISINANKEKVRIQALTDRSEMVGFITLRYTKTTD